MLYNLGKSNFRGISYIISEGKPLPSLVYKRHRSGKNTTLERLTHLKKLEILDELHNLALHIPCLGSGLALHMPCLGLYVVNNRWRCKVPWGLVRGLIFHDHLVIRSRLKVRRSSTTKSPSSLGMQTCPKEIRWYLFMPSVIKFAAFSI